MWLCQTDKLIVPEGSVNSASFTILVACSSFTGSPSRSMQPETVTFPELWFLRIVSTGVDDRPIWDMSCSFALVTVVLTVMVRHFTKYCLSLQLVTV